MVCSCSVKYMDKPAPDTLKEAPVEIPPEFASFKRL